MEFFKSNKEIFLLVALLFAVVFIWSANYSVMPGRLVVSVLDVGQGDAIFVETPNGNQMLVDGGPNNKVLSALNREMPFFDRSIDVLMVSNPDQDHIAGLIDVLRSYKVSAVILPGTAPETAVYKTFLEDISKEGARVLLARRGETIWLDNGVSMKIIFPDREVFRLDTNTGSIIARLSFGESAMLFTGDSPEGIENYLLETDGENLKSDVLKVGHHGSKTSSSFEFLGAVSPKYAAISVGEGNKYGHPNDEVLASLGKLGIEVFRTDEIGTIHFVSDGRQFEIID